MTTFLTAPHWSGAALRSGSEVTIMRITCKNRCVCVLLFLYNQIRCSSCFVVNVCVRACDTFFFCLQRIA